MSPRKSNLESTIYLGDDGWWHGRVTMGVHPDGSPDRRHRMARTEPAVRRKVRELEKCATRGARPRRAVSPRSDSGWRPT